MKKTQKTILAFSLMLMALLFVPASVQAASPSKKSLLNKIKKNTSQAIVSSYYDDFDMDGNKELFAITSDNSDYYLWYASKNQTCNVENNSYMDVWVSKDQGIVKVSKQQKLFLLEATWGGSSSHTVVCYIKKNKVYTVAKSGEAIGHISGKDFVVHPTAFDAMDDSGLQLGHTYKRYYIKWNGKGFTEYKGKAIKQAAFKEFSGGSSILSKIKKAGYKIGKLYKRSNGIININCYRYEGNTRYNENVTCKLTKNKVKVVNCNKNGNNIVEKSSYGGIYKASGF